MKYILLLLILLVLLGVLAINRQYWPYLISIAIAGTAFALWNFKVLN